jgi:hypothetical protein
MHTKSPLTAVPKLNPEWVKQFKDEFTEFLRITQFPEPQRNGARGSTFDFPESLIMLIAVLSVKCKIKSYQAIHHLVVQYWPILRPNPSLPPISESQLRGRLKKIKHSPRKPAAFIFQLFPETHETRSAHRERR